MTKRTASFALQVLLAGSLATAAAVAQPRVEEQDRNGDGKIDQWIMTDDGVTTTTSDLNGDGKIDQWVVKVDRITTCTIDQNGDGIVDALMVNRILPREEGSVYSASQDRDRDGQFDMLEVDWHDNIEQWKREFWSLNDAGQPNVHYRMLDRRAKIEVTGRTSELGSRELTTATTVPMPVPDFEELEDGGWMDRKARIRVVKRAGDRVHKVMFWNDKIEVEITDFGISNALPRTIHIREWDKEAGALKQAKQSLRIYGISVPARYRIWIWSRYKVGPDGLEKIRAEDRNLDGAQDYFLLTYSDGRTRTEKDLDHDGRLDVVVVETRDGTKATTNGADIFDRRLRSVPMAVPEDLIRSALEGAAADRPVR